MSNALSRLLRLRAAEADAARRDLAAALGVQGQAESRLEQAGDAMEAERRWAPCDAGHPLAGAYAAWLPAGRAAVDRAAAENRAAALALDAARAALADARMAAQACEKLADAQRDARRAKMDREMQHALEDSARRATG